ncbi:MAG: hypothetical protein ACR2MG_07530 [Pyrinomonadaceae bacterium]
MNFKQFYLSCLAHASYYPGSKKEALIIDPQRDVEQYLEEAKANGQKIVHINGGSLSVSAGFPQSMVALAALLDSLGFRPF